MSVLSRKFSRAKWESAAGQQPEAIAADTITADLRTTANTLSFWRCASTAEEELRKTVLALAAAADRLDKIDIVWISEEEVRSRGLHIQDSPGQTPVVSLQDRHADIADLNLGRLTAVASLIAQAVAKQQHKRLTKKEVVTIVAAAVRDRLLKIDDLSEEIRKDLQKEMAKAAPAHVSAPSLSEPGFFRIVEIVMAEDE